MKRILPFLLFLGVFSFAISYGSLAQKSGSTPGAAGVQAANANFSRLPLAPSIYWAPTSLVDTVWTGLDNNQPLYLINNGDTALNFMFPNYFEPNPVVSPYTYCSASGGCDEFISTVAINSITNSSGCTGYGNYTSVYTHLNTGMSYPVTVTLGPPSYSQDVTGVWIDFDHSSTFDEDELTQLSGYLPATGVITIPADASLGVTTMRIRTQYGGTLSPCGTTDYGEVEDYTVCIRKPSFVTDIYPVSGMIEPGDTVSVNITTSATGNYAAYGVYYDTLLLSTNDTVNPAINIPAEMHVLGYGELQGSLIDYVTHVPLPGIMVKALQNITMTDDSGHYSLSLMEGPYEVKFTRPGYDTIVAPLTIIRDTTVIYNDSLHFYPYRPACAYAEVINGDSACQITWCKPAGPQLLLYDDANAENYFTWDSICRINAVRFTPDDYPATLTGGQFYLGSIPYDGLPFTVAVYDDDGAGGLPGTLLDSVSCTTVFAPDGWITVNGLNATISSGDYYLSILHQCDSASCITLGVDETDPDAGRSYTRNMTAGEPWMLSTVQDFMIHAIVDEPVPPYSGKALARNSGSGMTDGLKSSGNDDASPAGNNDALEGLSHYMLCRAPVIDPLAGPQYGTDILLANDLIDTSFLEGGTTWICLPAGWYAYGIRGIYSDGSASEWRFTEPVAHKLYADVSVTVLSECNTMPLQGATVTLAGGEYPFDTLVQQTDTGGIASFSDIIKGVYEMSITSPGFETYNVFYNIQSHSTMEIILQVNPAKPENLSVDGATLLATWEPPQFDPPGSIADTSVLQGYAVYLDGTLQGQTQELYWDFSPACLNTGQSYTAAVAGVYCTGIGEADTFIFTSSYLPPPQNLTASATASVGIGTATFSWQMPDTSCTACDPVSFMIYNFGNLIGEIPAENLSYTIPSASPTTECLAVSAKYDLSCMGFPGQFGESAITEEVCIDITLGNDIPFSEDWGSGLFETNLWTPGQNWVIAGTGDSPSPAARFVSEPNLSGYSSALQSHWINALLTDTVMPYDIYLYYDLKLQKVAASSTEKLAVEVFGADGWTRVKEYVNSENLDLAQERLLISQQAKNRIFMIRFVAEGENTSNISWWETDNISVKAELTGVAPANLTASPYGNDGDDILLQWQPPAAGSYAAGRQGNNAGFFEPGSSEEVATIAPAELLGYNIYRRAFYSPNPGPGPGSGLWSLLASTVSGDTLYIDENLPNLETNCYEYYVTSFFSQGESSSSNTDSECICVGMKENTAEVPLLYPNPSDKWVNIILPERCKTLSLFNIAGKELKKIDTNGKQEITLDIKGFPSGAYLVRFGLSDGERITQKLLIRH
ncbi:MAG TPA: GEVED domain-containing protein [Bacteroidales bacterium]|nr:GEVED domain-containing protein [Bacteroidales bacterium]